MKSPAEYVAAAHANSMPATWCAARVAEVRAHVNTPEDWVPYATYRTWLIELLSQLDSSAIGAEAAVAAALADAERYKTNLLGAYLRSKPSTSQAPEATPPDEL